MKKPMKYSFAASQGKALHAKGRLKEGLETVTQRRRKKWWMLWLCDNLLRGKSIRFGSGQDTSQASYEVRYNEVRRCCGWQHGRRCSEGFPNQACQCGQTG